MKYHMLLAGCALCAAAAGCAGEVGGDPGSAGGPGAGEPQLGAVEQEVDGNWAVGPYSWYQGQATKYLKPVSTHVCVLTKAGGRFAGGSEAVRVGNDGNTWYLTGQSAESGVNGEAWCYAKGQFLANGSARWVSGQFEAMTNSSSCTSASTGTWWGDAATILTGVSGKLRGYGEKMYVVQSPGGFTSSSLNIESCQQPVRGWAHSFFAGTPSDGQPVKFYGAEYWADTAYAASGSNYHEVTMAPTGEAMCYLTYVAGKFDGSGEWGRIYPTLVSGIERWVLKAKAETYNGAPKPVRVKARCMKRDQR